MNTKFTITNHNNARSCYEQQDLGVDILTGAEFSCWVPGKNPGFEWEGQNPNNLVKPIAVSGPMKNTPRIYAAT